MEEFLTVAAMWIVIGLAGLFFLGGLYLFSYAMGNLAGRLFAPIPPSEEELREERELKRILAEIRRDELRREAKAARASK